MVAEPVARWGTMVGGPMAGARPEEELVAACRVHGRSPYNDLTTTRETEGTEPG